jgi:hypothetical protein
MIIFMAQGLFFLLLTIKLDEHRYSLKDKQRLERGQEDRNIADGDVLREE